MSGATPRSDETEILAGFIERTRFADVPDAAVAAARVVILDGLANMAAGSHEPVAQKVAAYVAPQGGRPDASIVNRSERVPAGQAALVNGVALHCLDYEVQGIPSAHGTSSILPALAAVAERDGLGGEGVLTAFVVGWDIQQRLRLACEEGDQRKFHPPGLVGPLAAAAGVSNLLGLDRQTTTMALGMAASRTGGLFGNNGTMTKATHPGNAARSGVESADLAALGVTSNPAILRDPRGFVAAAYSGVMDADLLLDGLGERYHLVDPGYVIKPFPAEILMQWPLDAMTELKARTGIQSKDVVAVVVEPPVVRDDLTRPAPITGLDGKFSYEYVVSAALIESRVHIHSFSDELRFSPEMERVLRLVSIRHNPEIPTHKSKTWARVIVTMADGTVHEQVSRAFEGMTGRPMSAETHAAKVQDCFDEGGLGDRLDEVRSLVASLETVPEFGRIMRLMSAP